MYIVIDSRDVVANGYKSGFDREGLACTTFAGHDFVDWLQSLSDSDINAVQAIIVGETEDRLGIPALIRPRGKTPIIALKEERGLDETLSLFNVGVDDVVKKPAPVRELVARAHAIWRRSNDAREQADFGRLTVYFDSRDPTVDGEPLELPRRERQILEYLVKHRRRRITKTQLFNAIYGLFNENVDETVIEGHISKLRKKLRQRLGYDVIDAKRFAGYAFICERQPCEIAPPAEQRRDDDRSEKADVPNLSLVASSSSHGLGGRHSSRPFQRDV
ncbi:response regulator transcription factor [Acuticoccus mangrovi]|uniref:Response regulator transcription factor n=1 Tax=Acuticoccus mangrovi TaxID=2796142 RepID=A0A934ILZ1_9HYPH|nr:response regulator transcription factor [Acuticoccus mangrovi]